MRDRPSNPSCFVPPFSLPVRIEIVSLRLGNHSMPHTSSQTFLREFDMNGAERPGRPSNVARRVHARARIKYFSDSFALAKGEKGGHWSGATKTSPQGCPKGRRGGANQYFKPKSIVRLIVEMIEPYKGRIYDAAMGVGRFFVGDTQPNGVRFAKQCRASARGVVLSERFIKEHGGTIGDIMVCGQDQWAWGAHLRHAPRAQGEATAEAAVSQSHHLAARGDEHGHPGHRLRQGTGGHLHPRPAPGPPRRARTIFLSPPENRTLLTFQPFFHLTLNTSRFVRIVFSKQPIS